VTQAVLKKGKKPMLYFRKNNVNLPISNLKA